MWVTTTVIVEDKNINLLNLNTLEKFKSIKFSTVIKILTPQGKLTFFVLFIFPKPKTTDTHTTFLQSCTHTMSGSQDGTPNGWFCVQTYHVRPDTLAPFIDNYKLTLYMVPSLEIAYQPSAHAGFPYRVWYISYSYILEYESG